MRRTPSRACFLISNQCGSPCNCARIQCQPKRRLGSAQRREGGGQRSLSITRFLPLWFCVVFQPRGRQRGGKFATAQLQHVRSIGINFELLHGQSDAPGDEHPSRWDGVQRLGDAPQRELLRDTVAPSHRQVATKARDLASR